MPPWQKASLGLQVGDIIIWQGEAIPPTAIVQFDNGITLMVDGRMKWARVAE